MTKLPVIDGIIRDASLPDSRLLFNAGIELQSVFAPAGIRYSAPYLEMGQELWVAAEYELYSILCDKKSRVPKGWASEIASGDVRDFVVAVLTALVASLSVPLSVAVPIASLAVKRELSTFCQLRLRKPTRTLSQIIERKRKAMGNDNRSSKPSTRPKRK